MARRKASSDPSENADLTNAGAAVAAVARPWYLYLIECTDGSIYTGISVDVEARYVAHCAGRGARYTRTHPPARLLGVAEYADRSSALKAECRVKKLRPEAKRQYAQALAAAQEAPGKTLESPLSNQTVLAAAGPDSGA